MKIVKADLNDIDEVKVIINLIYKVFSECDAIYSRESYIKKMELEYGPWYNYDTTFAILKESTLFFVAKEQNRIIGMIRWTKDKILNFYVVKKRQWKWIGQRLLKKFENIAKKSWSTAVRLKSSIYALNFYIKNGYTIVDNTTLIKQLI